MPTRSGREAVAICGLGAALAVVLTLPVAVRFVNGGRIDSGDGQFALWNVAWVARTLIANPGRLYDANIFFPEPNALAFSEANIFAGAVAVPAYWLTGSPYAAYNFALLVAFTASFTATFYLVRHLTGDPRASLVSAVAFAFCPYVFARIPHIQLQMTAGLPLALLALHRIVDRPGLGRALALGGALALQALACAYYAIFAGLTVGLGVLYYAGVRGLWSSVRFWTAIVVAAASAGLFVLPFFLPYVEVQRIGFARSLEDARQFPADWKAYFASSAWAHRWILPWLGTWREVLFPGFLTTGLGAAGFWMARRRAAFPEARRDAVPFYAIVALLACWASFGPAAGLYTGFYHTVPLFSFLRAPGRFGILVTLCLAVLAGFAVERLLRERTATLRRWVGGALVVLMILELTQIPIRWRTAPPVPKAYQLLAELPRGVVVEFPFFHERIDFHRHTLYMLNSTFHWQPLVNGYSDHIPDFFRRIALPLSSFPSREAFRILVPELEPERARYAVFHLRMYDRRSRERLLDRIKQYRPFLKPLVLEDDIWLYEIVGWPS